MKEKNPAKKVAKKTARKSAPVKKLEAVKPECCETCRYAKEYDDSKVMCRRYPAVAGMKQQATMPKVGWCGEYQKGE